MQAAPKGRYAFKMVFLNIPILVCLAACGYAAGRIADFGSRMYIPVFTQLVPYTLLTLAQAVALVVFIRIIAGEPVRRKVYSVLFCGFVYLVLALLAYFSLLGALLMHAAQVWMGMGLLLLAFSVVYLKKANP